MMIKAALVLAYPDCILFEIIPAAQRLDPLFPARQEPVPYLPLVRAARWGSYHQESGAGDS